MSGDMGDGGTVYAAGLGLIIAVMGVAVCRKVWKHLLLRARGRRTQPGQGLLEITFIVQVLALLASCYAFLHVAYTMKTEVEYFDPYHILELPSRANSTVIRSQYRRLSLKHHPDKNPGNRREANKRFNQVAKAYKALSDPDARRNWEQYGHPDGFQPWTFDLALPGWLRPSKDTGNGTLALYGLGYMAVLIGFVLSVKLSLDMMDPAGGSKKPQFKVTGEDVEALMKNLDDMSSTSDVLECLATCPQLCTEERRTLAEEMEPLTAPLRGWLLNLDGGAPPLRGGSHRPRPRPAASPPARETAARKGKGKGKGKGSSKSKGGGGGEREAEPAVEEEFFTQGRRGEGNRWSIRESPELAKVVTHNLVVLLSAIYRAPPGVVAGAAAEATGGVGSGSSSPASPEEADDGGPATGAERRGSGAGGKEDGDEDIDDAAASSSSQGLADAAVAAGGRLAREQDLVFGLGGGRAGGAGGRGGDAVDGVDGDDKDAVSRLLAAVAAGGQLAREQELVFGIAEPLLDACVHVAAKRASPQLFGTVVETKAMLRRRLWSSEDPVALNKQREEADAELDAAVPRIKVDSVVVETWGESQVAVGDTVTATVTIVRDHAPEYRGLRRRRPQAGSFIAKGEPWWVILAEGRGGNSLIGVTPMLVENLGSDIADCKIKFQAPRRPGFVKLAVSVKSPIFVGVDCESTAEFRVWRHDELKQDDDAGDW